MAGHSKWANIKHRKERVDNKRGKAFSRAVKEIAVAAQIGGPDPNANPRLRLALQKAKQINLPNDNIDKAIKRGSGQLQGVNYEEVRYEGYGPEGVAVIVDCLTDNRNRTLTEVRTAFTKNSGSLGTDGSVSYLFRRIGQIIYAPGCAQDAVAEAAIEAGAEDIVTEDDGSIEVLTESGSFHQILEKLTEAGFASDAADMIMHPNSTVAVADKNAEKVRKMIGALENCDDTQHIHTNAVFED
ncbi:MAG: YebC/PmpR family DNA-binding transcriptional regulator [Betaproteobacteria bacterium]|nr:YebC/PmpR family DNA-binding transcriptional regulator [Betaproteobacteria bacterium]